MCHFWTQALVFVLLSVLRWLLIMGIRNGLPERFIVTIRQSSLAHGRTKLIKQGQDARAHARCELGLSRSVMAFLVLSSDLEKLPRW